MSYGTPSFLLHVPFWHHNYYWCSAALHREREIILFVTVLQDIFNETFWILSHIDWCLTCGMWPVRQFYSYPKVRNKSFPLGAKSYRQRRAIFGLQWKNWLDKPIFVRNLRISAFSWISVCRANSSITMRAFKWAPLRVKIRPQWYTHNNGTFWCV